MSKQEKDTKSNTEDIVSQSDSRNSQINNNNNSTSKSKNINSNSLYDNKLWKQNKYDLDAWTKSKFQQSMKMKKNYLYGIPDQVFSSRKSMTIWNFHINVLLDCGKFPKYFSQHPNNIQVSSFSTLSSLTNNKDTIRYKNVDDFINKWKKNIRHRDT